MGFGKHRDSYRQRYITIRLSDIIGKHWMPSGNIDCLSLAVVIMITAYGMHSIFPGRHPVFSDYLYIRCFSDDNMMFFPIFTDLARTLPSYIRHIHVLTFGYSLYLDLCNIYACTSIRFRTF